MNLELLTPAQMAEADRLAIAEGPFDGIGLMRNAGAAVAAVVQERFPAAKRVHVLVGPGNNGGDGYVVAKILHECGISVSVWASAAPRDGSDAAIVAAECPVPEQSLAGFDAEADELIVDALYGAGLSKPLVDDAARAVARVASMRLPVVAVDMPSGVSGESGKVLGCAFRATLTVTFARKKTGHLLLPGRELCGELIVADIGIAPDVIDALAVSTSENQPSLWRKAFPSLEVDTHKYRRGHVSVFSGGPTSTGAARLSALAAARAGAGAVTVLAPGSALAVNAMHLTSIMLRKVDDVAELAAVLGEGRSSAFVLGPGFGVGEKARDFTLAVLAAGGRLSEPSAKGLVLDADGITAFRDAPQWLFEAAGRPEAPALVLTPHDGEFARLFPDIAGNDDLSKLGKARAAAEAAHAVVVYKGADTVIAAPDGRAAINSNGAPWLATAGSGDVLTGIVAGLIAQQMPAFEAACAGVWLHAEAGKCFGPGLIAEDLPGALVPVVAPLYQPGQVPPFQTEKHGLAS